MGSWFQSRPDYEVFKHGQTVRLIGGAWTPSQRQCLWVVDLSNRSEGVDWGSMTVNVHRQADPDCIVGAPRKWITAATVLDLLANS